MALVTKTCNRKGCFVKHEARQADINRGWGQFCGKSCKALAQEKRTGQYSNWLHRKVPRRRSVVELEYDPHPFSQEALGQWDD